MKYHLIGIGGTGMGALAGLLKAAGHEVRGSDRAIYPPMSEQLEVLAISVFEGFDSKNLEWSPDVVVVGNVCSKDHVEVVEAQRLELPLTSLPSVIGEEFLDSRQSLVVVGTHGKTTTTSLLSHLLIDAGRDPSCFIGGVPQNIGQGWKLGDGSEFVVEGDEYDSAFFDKGSKFLHYRPHAAILTSVELDHVDIFSSMEAVRDTFRKFVALIPEDGLLVVCADSEEAMEIAKTARCRVEGYSAPTDEDSDNDALWQATNIEYLESGRCRFQVMRSGELFETFEILLTGVHNVANATAAIAIAHSLGISSAIISRGVSTFAGVRRRQELRGVAQGVYVIDDYGHHPTSVAETLKGLRRRFTGRRIVALYEPRSATSRRKTFQREFVDAFAHADDVVVWRLHDPSRIPTEERFDPGKLALDLHQSGTRASYIESTDDIVAHIVEFARPGDVVVVFSCGSFDNIIDKLLSSLGDPIVPAKPVDIESIRGLLKELDLDWQDVVGGSHQVFRALFNETGFVGCVGLEVFGEDAVLRSLAVKKDARGVGYGWMLADSAISLARYRGVRRIYLVTESATDFFAAKHGFRVVDLSTVSPDVARSSTFRSRRKSVVAMRLDL